MHIQTPFFRTPEEQEREIKRSIRRLVAMGFFYGACVGMLFAYGLGALR